MIFSSTHISLQLTCTETLNTNWFLIGKGMKIPSHLKLGHATERRRLLRIFHFALWHVHRVFLEIKVRYLLNLQMSLFWVHEWICVFSSKFLKRKFTELYELTFFWGGGEVLGESLFHSRKYLWEEDHNIKYWWCQNAPCKQPLPLPARATRAWAARAILKSFRL